MSVEAVPGGRRRIDRVLDPRFVADVEALGLDELRSRRSEAEAEERSISYLRRMMQGRLDILRAELERRARGGEHDLSALVAGLPMILSGRRWSMRWPARRRWCPPTAGRCCKSSTCSAASSLAAIAREPQAWPSFSSDRRRRSERVGSRGDVPRSPTVSQHLDTPD